MNNARRKSLADIKNKLDELVGLIEEQRDELETLKGEEEEYKENMPENMQDGEKGQAADQAISDLEEAFSAADSAADSLREAMDKIDEASA